MMLMIRLPDKLYALFGTYNPKSPQTAIEFALKSWAGWDDEKEGTEPSEVLPLAYLKGRNDGML